MEKNFFYYEENFNLTDITAIYIKKVIKKGDFISDNRLPLIGKLKFIELKNKTVSTNQWNIPLSEVNILDMEYNGNVVLTKSDMINKIIETN
jgi:hypothetical protein